MKINKLYLAWFFYLLISCYSLHNLNQNGFLYENYSFKLTTQSIKFHWKVSCTFYNFYLENILGQKKKYTIVSGNVGDEKNIHLGDCKKLFYQFNWIFSTKFTLKNYSNRTFPCWKTESPIFYCLKGKKRKSIQINLLVEIFLFVHVFL